jgi:hypothetical protein
LLVLSMRIMFSFVGCILSCCVFCYEAPSLRTRLSWWVVDSPVACCAAYRVFECKSARERCNVILRSSYLFSSPQLLCPVFKWIPDSASHVRWSPETHLQKTWRYCYYKVMKTSKTLHPETKSIEVGDLTKKNIPASGKYD